MKKHKSAKTTLILILLLGYLGIHQFYLGNRMKGILYLFTCGLFGVGTLIDLIKIFTSGIKINDGKELIFLEDGFHIEDNLSSKIGSV